MATHSFQVVLEWDPESQVWVTYVPPLDFLSTFGDSREEALANTREAILGYLEAAAKEGLSVPYDGTKAGLVSVEVQVA
jgi:predicted RNase H-like HicB family nuclease